MGQHIRCPVPFDRYVYPRNDSTFYLQISMRSHTSRTFPSLKAIAFLALTAASAALIAPKFVHADEASVQTAAATAAKASKAATPVAATEQQPSTPASTNYYDGIDVAVIAVAAYDH